jgi:hypothetical protein
MVALRFSLPWFIPHSFPFNSIFQFQLVYQSCPVALFLSKPVAQKVICIFQTASPAGEMEQCCKQDLTVGVWYMLMIQKNVSMTPVKGKSSGKYLSLCRLN